MKTTKTSAVRMFVNAFDGEDTTTNPGTQSTEAPKYTDADLQAKVAEAQKKFQDEQRQALSKLQMLEQKSKLTEAERTELQKTVDDLRKKVFTTEELQAQEAKKAADKYQQDLDAATTESKAWKTRYTEESITRSIMDAAVKSDSFNPNQIVALLKGDSVLDEVLDADGNVTGYAPVVKMKGVDPKDKKTPVELILTPEQAVERLKSDSNYFNLFKSTIKDGPGNSNTSGKGTLSLVEAAKLPPEEYRKWRETNNL